MMPVCFLKQDTAVGKARACKDVVREMYGGRIINWHLSMMLPLDSKCKTFMYGQPLHKQWADESFYSETKESV
jgi:hypothetical protein